MHICAPMCIESLHIEICAHTRACVLYAAPSRLVSGRGCGRGRGRGCARGLSRLDSLSDRPEAGDAPGASAFGSGGRQQGRGRGRGGWPDWRLDGVDCLKRVGCL